MPIAKETLRIGFVVAANPGGYVSKAAVKANGWADQVEDGPDVGGTATGEDEAAKPAKKAAAKAES